jgi:hypothetical protein
MPAKSCGIRTYGGSALIHDVSEGWNRQGPQVREFPAHGTIVIFLYAQSRLCVTRMRFFDCGRLCKKGKPESQVREVG